MFIALLAAAAVIAAVPPSKNGEVISGDRATPEQMNLNRKDAERCRVEILDALAKDKAGVSGQSWKPKNYPEAGYYFTLNKRVDGCPVPVPVKAPKR